jgi:hypothetical protein
LRPETHFPTYLFLGLSKRETRSQVALGSFDVLRILKAWKFCLHVVAVNSGGKLGQQRFDLSVAVIPHDH